MHGPSRMLLSCRSTGSVRRDHAGELWHEISGNLPPRFRVCDRCHAMSGEVYVGPIKRASRAFPDVKCGVRSSRAGKNGEGGRLRKVCRKRTLRERSAGCDGGGFTRNAACISQNEWRAGIRLRPTRGINGTMADLAAVLLWRSNACHDSEFLLRRT